MIKVTRYAIVNDNHLFFIEDSDRVLLKSEIESLLRMGLVNLSREQYNQILATS